MIVSDFMVNCKLNKLIFLYLNQALQILAIATVPYIIIIYSVMIQYTYITVLNINMPQKSLACVTRKDTVETISKQLE